MVSPLADVKKDAKDKPAGSKSRTGKESSAVRKGPRIKKIRADQP